MHCSKCVSFWGTSYSRPLPIPHFSPVTKSWRGGIRQTTRLLVPPCIDWFISVLHARSRRRICRPRISSAHSHLAISHVRHFNRLVTCLYTANGISLGHVLCRPRYAASSNAGKLGFPVYTHRATVT